MKHKNSCPAYSNYQPPYEECNCDADIEKCICANGEIELFGEPDLLCKANIHNTKSIGIINTMTKKPKKTPGGHKNPKGKTHASVTTQRKQARLLADLDNRVRFIEGMLGLNRPTIHVRDI